MAPRGARRKHGERVGQAAHEIARAFDRIDGDVGLEGGARPPEPLAALGLGCLPLCRLADHDERIDVDLGQGVTHGVERRAAAVLGVAAADPVERGAGGALGHPAERKHKLRIALHVFSSTLRPARGLIARPVRPGTMGRAGPNLQALRTA